MANTTIRHSGGLLVCDAVSDASIETTLDFTEHPIDDGSTISDHAVRKPETISLTLTHTQTPLRKIEGFAPANVALQVKAVTYGKQQTKLDIPSKGIAPNVAGLISAGLSALKGAVPPSIQGLKIAPDGSRNFGVTVLQANAGVDRIGEFYNTLLKVQLAVERVTLTFKGRDFADYVITTVRKSDKPGAVGKSTFDVSLKKVRTVATKQVELPAVPRAKKKKDIGVQYGPPPPPVSEEKARKAIAVQIVEIAKG